MMLRFANESVPIDSEWAMIILDFRLGLLFTNGRNSSPA
jgi:hypothetical protein